MHKVVFVKKPRGKMKWPVRYNAPCQVFPQGSLHLFGCHLPFEKGMITPDSELAETLNAALRHAYLHNMIVVVEQV